MMTSFHIQNFRCFRDFQIESLDRVNLITGMNNAGKTSLLEAICLYAGPKHAQQFLQQNALRDDRPLQQAKETYEGLFWNKDTDIRIEITTKSDNGSHHALNAVFSYPNFPDKSLKNIAFYYIVGSDQITQASFSHFTHGRVDTNGSIQEAALAVFPSASTGIEHSHVEQFSNLEEKGRSEDLMRVLKILEPRLCDLTLLVKGGITILHGNVGLEKLLPLQNMGEGVLRLTTLLLGIAEAKDGLVLIDEIGSGFHYSVMPKVWAAIALAARQNNVQIFATTHSWECIRAAHEAFSQSEPYDFRLHRLERVKDSDDIRAVTYDPEMIATAMEDGFEVR